MKNACIYLFHLNRFMHTWFSRVIPSTVTLATLSCGQISSKMQVIAQTTANSETVLTSSETARHLAQDGSLERSGKYPTVTLAQGTIKGIRTEQGSQFLGIPYAKPPVGNLRFKRPVPIDPGSGTQLAWSWPHKCKQNQLLLLGWSVSGDEDCLYSNVWVPTKSTSKPLPIMVFIHGGAFDNGSGHGPYDGFDWYTGDRLATLGGVIVVTFNYRIGALGFLAHPALRRQLGGVNGNLGIYDQIQALSWVQDNISKFGGDPDNVTIFGESAGAMSICTLIAQKYKKGLFHKAIMESGSCQAQTRASAEAYGVSLATQLGCRGTDSQIYNCLLKKDANAIVTTQKNIDMLEYAQKPVFRLPFAPIIDGTLYSNYPLAIIQAGQHQKVDMIIGNNSSEIPTFVFENPDITSPSQVYDIAMTSGISASTAQKIYADYALETSNDPKEIISAIATDSQFTCAGNELAKILGDQNQNIHQYLWDSLGASSFHGMELLQVFQHDTDPNRATVMTAMGKYWTDFAKGDSLDNWPAYSTTAGTTHKYFGPGSMSLIFNHHSSLCKQVLNAGMRIQRDSSYDVNGDGYDDFCERVTDGITCRLGNSSGTYGKPSYWNDAFNDAAGWSEAAYGSTVQFGDINGDGKADVCGRGVAGFYCGISYGNGFASISLWEGQFSNANGWSRAEAYPTIKLVEKNGDGNLDICGVKDGVTTCLYSTGSNFVPAGIR